MDNSFARINGSSHVRDLPLMETPARDPNPLDQTVIEVVAERFTRTPQPQNGRRIEASHYAPSPLQLDSARTWSGFTKSASRQDSPIVTAADVWKARPESVNSVSPTSSMNNSSTGGMTPSPLKPAEKTTPSIDVNDFPSFRSSNPTPKSGSYAQDLSAADLPYLGDVTRSPGNTRQKRECFASLIMEAQKSVPETPIDPNKKEPQMVVLTNQIAQRILFSQDSISEMANQSRTTTTPLVDFAQHLHKQGFDPSCAIDVVHHERQWISIDNRRLCVAQAIAVHEPYPIYVRAHESEEPLPVNYEYRFPRARKWGDALTMRIHNTRELHEGLVVKGFPRVVVRNNGTSKQLTFDGRSFSLSPLGQSR